MENELNMTQINELAGESLGSVCAALCAIIEEKYDMEHLWNSGGKTWDYEYKYRRGGKTLCALYVREGCIGFMVILGKAEQEKFENHRSEFSKEVQQVYDEAETYHDGKWIMFFPKDQSMFGDFMRLLEIKRKPNRK